MIPDAARTFAAERLRPFSAEWDRESRFPREALAEMGALGFLGMLVPEAYDGAAVVHVA
jgi:butyryl-CoA dehydrogenase